MKIKSRQSITADQAFEAANTNKDASRWPARTAGNRLEPYFIPSLNPRFKLSRDAKIFTLGSCFARSIEENLAAKGMRVPMLSFSVPKTEYPHRSNGILNKYTPLNMVQEVRRAAEAGSDWNKVDAEAGRLLFPTGHNDTVIDLELVAFIPTNRQRAMERRREVHKIFVEAFDCDIIIITLGLIECWFDNETGYAIEGTPIAPALLRAKNRFSFRLLDFAEAHAAMSEMIEILIKNGNPKKKIILTVSPVPLFATFSGTDVVVANCFGKSLLRSVAQRLFMDFDCVDYFPSYEMAIYSKAPEIWEDDLIHVTDEFAQHVVEVMLEAYL